MHVLSRFLLLSFLLLLLAGCGIAHHAAPAPTATPVPTATTVPAATPTPSGPTPTPTVVVPQSGTVLTDGQGVGRGFTKSFPGSTLALWRPPYVPWGIDYAYHCRRRGNFRVLVRIVNVDGFMPDTTIVRSGLAGRGWEPETHHGTQSYNVTYPMYRFDENLDVYTPCAWHVAVVVGGPAVLRRHIPPLPPARG